MLLLEKTRWNFNMFHYFCNYFSPNRVNISGIIFQMYCCYQVRISEAYIKRRVVLFFWPYFYMKQISSLFES